MNICIVTHNVLKGDGQGRVNYEIVNELLEQGHNVALYATKIAPEFERHPRIEYVHIAVQGWPTRLLKNQIFALVSSLKLMKRKKNYDLIVMNGYIAWLRSDINNVHFVHSAWQNSTAHPYRLQKGWKGRYQMLFTKINAFLERGAFQRSGLLIPVSQKVQQEIEQIPEVNKPIQVILNGADLQSFSPAPVKKKELRRMFELPESVILAMFAGDIKSPRKNLDSVLKAMPQNPDLHLAVAGALEGSPYPEMARELGLNERVHFLGFQKDVAALMKCADCFVFPSRYEACSLVVMEALASGLPVITTEASGVGEVIAGDGGSGKAGFVLKDPEDLKQLAQSLLVLTEDEQLREQMGQAAREAVQPYDWKKVAKRYVALYEQVHRQKEKQRGAVYEYSSST
ncbi:glycosyltransferase family 1 protein [Paenibacillaceae bacterium]|nr:glycosyltransferase family 1 protein [Paenibacillaceae bacterium]